MAHTYCSLQVHCVFATKRREPWIEDDLEKPLWAYMGGVIRGMGLKPLCIGGVLDHVHILMSLSTTATLGMAVQMIKGRSSKWVHETYPGLAAFGWQDGYGAFSVSASHVEQTEAYIRNQKEHHRLRTFDEEFVAFLARHRLDFENHPWI